MMSEVSGQRRAPHTGTLAGRPLAALLASATDGGTSGSITLTSVQEQATIRMRAGLVVAIHTRGRSALLGEVLADLRFIDEATLECALLDARARHARLGTILVDLGAITTKQLDEALAEQIRRRLLFCFTLPEATTFAVRDGHHDTDWPREQGQHSQRGIDPWPAIWTQVRSRPPLPHVKRALERVKLPVRVANTLVVQRLQLDAEERAAVATLVAQATTIAEFVENCPLGIDRARALVYVLGLARALSAESSEMLGPNDLGIEGVRARARKIQTLKEDPYAVLGLPAGASDEAARAAFFRLARLWNPDRLAPEIADAVIEECRVIHFSMTRAYATICESSEVTFSRAPPSIQESTLRTIDSAIDRGEFVAAADLARRLARTGTEGPSARAIVAWCEARAGGSSEAARAALDRILAGDPDCVRALFYRGKILGEDGNHEAAIADLRKVMRLEPTHAGAKYELGVLAGRDTASLSHASGLRRLYRHLTS